MNVDQTTDNTSRFWWLGPLAYAACFIGCAVAWCYLGWRVEANTLNELLALFLAFLATLPLAIVHSVFLPYL